MKRLPAELEHIPADVIALVTAQVARSYRALPVRLKGPRLVVAMASAGETRTIKALQFATERDIEPLVVPVESLDLAIEAYYGAGRAAAARPAAQARPEPVPAPAARDFADALLDDLGMDDLLAAEPAAPAVPAAPAPVAPGRPVPPGRPAPGAEATVPMPPPIQRPAAIETIEVDASAIEKSSEAALRLLSPDTARNFRALPVEADDRTITVAFAAPPDTRTLRAIQYATGRLVRPLLAPREAVEAGILRQYPARAPRAAPRTGPVPSIDPKLLLDVDPELIGLLRADLARRVKAVPVEKLGRRLTVAMEDPTDLEAVQNVEFVAGLTVKALRCDPEALDAAIERYYPPEAAEQAARILAGADAAELDDVEVVDEDEGKELPVHDLDELAGEDAPAVKLSNMLIREAVQRGASDIHIEIYENDFRVRYRVDGVLAEVARPPKAVRASLLSRIKVLSGMNIAETRMPQDGRIKLRMKQGDRAKNIDLRVSAVPTMWGEKMVMRVLDPDRLMLDLTRLGFDRGALDRFDRAIRKPYGMILVVGPSGCGKTNTLYSAISAVNEPGTNIVTAEDPVEFNIKGINQVQTDEVVGLTFAAALRSFLRQDPNIILVGEIRDYETAEIAMKASLTGHLVLSTLHTTDAPTTVSRLVNMGIEPFMVANSVLLISAQRLVRTICGECREPDPRPDHELLALGFRPDELPVVPQKGRGCRACQQRGLKGRTALFEVLEVTEAIQELIIQGATPIEIKRTAREAGMLTLRDSGLRKIKEGVTTVDEVERETMR